MSTPIQLDPVFSYQQAALLETYRVLCQTHGETFAAHFVDECKDEVLRAAKTRMCGRSEADLLQETTRLRRGLSSILD
jgi:plasmid stabilization system protein ParE